MKSININDYNSTNELYTKNKKVFWAWFIAWSVLFATILIFVIASFIQFAVEKQNYLNKYAELFGQIQKLNPNFQGDVFALANNEYVKSLAMSGVLLVILIAVYVWHIVSIALVAKNKDFSAYSRILTTLYLFVIIYEIITLIFSGFQSFSLAIWQVNKILNLVATLLYIVSYFAVFLKCSYVAKLFLILKRNLAFKALNNSGSMDDILRSYFYGQESPEPTLNTNNTFDSNQKTDENKSEDLNKEEDSRSIEYRSKLEQLNDEQLQNMAKKLNIFGIETFSREQLISKISDIFEQSAKSQNQQSKPDNSDEDNNGGSQTSN
ncbi:hypothetical protein C1937_00780 [Metamycoplasma hominis]|uniref:hypothetical protein n=1 Tax=Metamycoplasma hominis TaxID=2098 RepID=UPI000CD6BEBB|nr:hypothetical protein [Metamycoplasma hominis]AUW36987.1 hypothetical protein C1937_00780 [Metamycoplasma hominis]